jgi:hypothetical protein
LSTLTTHYNLIKPATSDVITQTVSDISDSFDIVDTSLYAVETEVTGSRTGLRGETNTALNDRLDTIESNLGLITPITTSSLLTIAQRGAILVDTTSNHITLTLPTATSTSLMVYTIKKTSIDSNTVIIDANSSETIDGELTFTLYKQFDSVKILNDGSNWLIIDYFTSASISTQSSKVNDPTGGTTIDSEARTAINAILDTLEAFGLQASS